MGVPVAGATLYTDVTDLDRDAWGRCNTFSAALRMSLNETRVLE